MLLLLVKKRPYFLYLLYISCIFLIVAKVLAAHFEMVLPGLLSQEQNCFIKGLHLVFSVHTLLSCLN